MTDPTYGADEGRPPGYSEGPPDDEGAMAKARAHVERLDHQNEPSGDSNGLYGPGREAVNGPDGCDAPESS